MRLRRALQASREAMVLFIRFKNPGFVLSGHGHGAIHPRVVSYRGQSYGILFLPPAGQVEVVEQYREEGCVCAKKIEGCFASRGGV